tara:strand:+ start:398 stop:688 length:291 start_codon:yes stop_codon:yes gene_type:complete
MIKKLNMKLTTKKVEKYIAFRSNQELRHCSNCIAAACNDAAIRFNHYNSKDFMKLWLFNDPIPVLHTHSYGFHTATGRNIIDTTIEYYYKYKNLEL